MQVKDVFIVWTLLVVFVAAFAITSQALIFDENSQTFVDTLGEMLKRAYWPMFGQYNLDEWDQGVLVLVLASPIRTVHFHTDRLHARTPYVQY